MADTSIDGRFLGLARRMRTLQQRVATHHANGEMPAPETLEALVVAQIRFDWALHDMENRRRGHFDREEN